MKIAERKIQDLLSLGYLYILFLGILKNTIYYWFVGVNILNYSSVMDVLLTPISTLTEKPATLVFLFIITFLFYISKNTKLFAKLSKKSKAKEDSITQVEKNPTSHQRLDSIVGIAVIGLGAFYLGIGIGSGDKIAKQIQNNEVKKIDHIQYMDGEEKNVKIVGENSSYIFFIEDDNNFISISPISGVVKRIQKHKEKSKLFKNN